MEIKVQAETVGEAFRKVLEEVKWKLDANMVKLIVKEVSCELLLKWDTPTPEFTFEVIQIN